MRVDLAIVDAAQARRYVLVLSEPSTPNELPDLAERKWRNAFDPVDNQLLNEGADHCHTCRGLRPESLDLRVDMRDEIHDPSLHLKWRQEYPVSKKAGDVNALNRCACLPEPLENLGAVGLDQDG